MKNCMVGDERRGDNSDAETGVEGSTVDGGEVVRALILAIKIKLLLLLFWLGRDDDE